MAGLAAPKQNNEPAHGQARNGHTAKHGRGEAGHEAIHQEAGCHARFHYVADVMDAGHADPKMLISSVIALDELPATFERLRGPNTETKVQVAPASLRATTG